MFVYALVTMVLLSTGELEADVSYHDTLAECQALGAIEIMTQPNLRFVGCAQALEV
jgi:hypothetical protein